MSDLRLTISLAASGVLVAVLGGCLSPRPRALPAPAAPSAASCQSAVEAARSLTDTLPADDLSRRAAESDLVQAMVEAGNGEFDDCLEFAARAAADVREHRYGPKPVESPELRRPTSH
jgi:hypothetical protein